MKIPFMKQIAWYLVIALFVISSVPPVEAGFSPSEIIALQPFDRNTDIEKIRMILETKMVRERLKAFGMSQQDISSRLENLSDQQLHQLALKVDDLKIGGDGLGVVIALLVIAILVVILLQLTGHRIIVTK